MKHNHITATLIILLTLSLSTSLFASGVALTGIGARATVLSGAYRGIANDWSAMYWNPAGLTNIQGMHFGFSSEILFLKGKYTAKSPVFGALRSEEVENEGGTYIIPAGGFVWGTEKYALGISVFAPFGLGAKWDLLNTSVYNSAYPEFDLEDDLKILDIHPSFAYKVNDKFSVGFGVSIMSNKIEVRKPAMIPNPYLNPAMANEPAFAAFYTGMNAYGALDVPYDHIISEIDLEGDGMGFGANFGIMYKPTEDLSIGISGRYYMDQKLEGTINGELYFINNPTVHQFIQDNGLPMIQYLQGNGIIDASQAQMLQYLYSGGTTPIVPPNTSIEADMPLPMNIGIGIGYSGIENLLLTFDVDWTQWSVWDYIPFTTPNGVEIGRLTEEWDDAIRIAAGLEYTMGLLKLRTSFYTEPATPPDKTMSPTIPEVNRRYVANLGFGYDLGFGTIHVSGEYMFISDRTVDTWNMVLDADGDPAGYDNMAGTYKMNIMTIMLGLDVNLSE